MEKATLTGLYIQTIICDYRKNCFGYRIITYSTTDFPEGHPAKGTSKTDVRVWCKEPLPEIRNTTLRFYGSWYLNKRKEWQFGADFYEVEPPKKVAGMESLLASGYFDYIGKKLAERIVDTFKEDTLKTIEENPLALVRVRGMNPKKANLLHEDYLRLKSFSDLVLFLTPLGISISNIRKVNNKYGKEAIKNIKENPYFLIEELNMPFTVCDGIAQATNVALDSDIRIAGAILFVLARCTKQEAGMYLLKDTLKANCFKLLNANGQTNVSDEKFEEVFNDLKQKQKVVLRAKKFVYLENSEKTEYSIAQNLKKLVEQKSAFNRKKIETSLESYCKLSKIDLHENQKNAVINGLTNNVSIVTGGAGTGKTTVINAIIACYKRNSRGEIILLAPTGKAARRIEEATHQNASTIHSRLKIYDDEIADDEIRKLPPHSLVIVDEVSMVGEYLMNKLLSALSNDTILVLLGDKNQLESVEAGSILADLISSSRIPMTYLTKIYRQEGGSIVENSLKVINKTYNLQYDDSFVFYETKDDEEAFKLAQEKYIEECKKFGMNEVSLLTPLRQPGENNYLVCSDTLNSSIQDTINEDDFKKKAVYFGKKVFREGDRVMQWQNTKVASNGDTGVISAIYDDPNEGTVIVVEWENGNTATYHKSDLETITLAYAMSIHKSQGSEYQSVIIPLLRSQENCPLYKNNLLYTGITRAKKKVIIIGNKSALNKCIQRQNEVKRNTLLSERLVYNLAA